MHYTVRASLAALLISLTVATAEAAGGVLSHLPELTHTSPKSFINTAPLTLAGLRGKVVLVEFWTFDCINCRRSLPWLKAMQERYADQGLVLLGVHTPELPQEKDADNVRAAVKRLGVSWPVMLDADFSYWNALGNRYWPAFYLVDRTGTLRSFAAGEMHLDETRGVELERQILALLKATP